METYSFVQRSVFQGTDGLFMDGNNLSYWINKDQTGFYVFSMMPGGVPECLWVRRTRNSPDISNFEAAYAAKVNYAGDMVNGYKITHGLYMDLGAGDLQAHLHC